MKKIDSQVYIMKISLRLDYEETKGKFLSIVVKFLHGDNKCIKGPIS